MADTVRIAIDDLRDTVVAGLVASGARPDDARTVAEITIDADLDGRASHGVARIPAFLAKLKHGGIDPVAVPTVDHDNGVVFGIDGRAGFGQVAVALATSMAIERAAKFGISCGTVRETNNPGMLGAYGRRAADAGQIAILACNATPAMPPHGGSAALLGTNPLCIAVPHLGGAAPILDMATSAAAKGAIRDASRKGLPIPPDWALDRVGLPTTDPVEALAGLLRPAGGAKGSGLALMIELLAGVLAGAATGPAVRGLHDPEPSRVGAIIITLAVEAFLPRAEFEERLDGYLGEVRAIPPAPGFHEVLVPGDRGWRDRQRNLVDGVSIPAALWADLQGLATGGVA
jgi:LDH2 family malate/lactate/ureidoglycolate dehydrogenase